MSATTKQHDTRELRLELFGGPLLRRHGEVVRLSPHQAAFLAIAFSEGRNRIPRKAVQRSLWDIEDGKAVRHRLSQLVYQTNRKCGRKVTQLDGEFIRVHREAVRCDLDDWADMIRTKKFREAYAFIEAGFLSACPEVGKSTFSDWVGCQFIAKRGRLRTEVLVALEEAHSEGNRPVALEAAEVLFRIDPNEEVALQRKMRMDVMYGEVNETEASYQAFGLRKDPTGQWIALRETQELFKAVRSMVEGRSEESRALNDLTPAAPMSGRSDELARLIRHVTRTDDQVPWKTVTIGGEAGLGKTRLVEAAINRARLHGSAIIRASAAELERDIPLSPLLEGLKQYSTAAARGESEQSWQPELDSLLSQVRESPGPGSHGDMRRDKLPRHTCEAFLRLLTEIASTRKVVLFLDDSQWADTATAAVLHFLKRRWSAGNFTLLLAYRPEELPTGHPVTRLLQKLEADPASTTIRLEGMEDHQMRQLAESTSPRTLSDTELDEVTALANGNPMFLGALLAQSATGDEHRPGGAVLVPPSLQQLVNTRVERLTASAKRVISVLVVLDDATTLEQLTQILGHDSDQCVDAIEQLQALHLVEWTGREVRARPDIVRHAIYRTLSPARRSMLHASMAELIRSRSEDPPLERVAFHYSRAGDHELAHLYALEAASAADSKTAAERQRVLSFAYDVSRGVRRAPVAARLARLKYRSLELRAALRLSRVALEDASALSLSESLTVRLIEADSRNLLGIDPADTTLEKLACIEKEARGDGEERCLAAILDTTRRLIVRSGEHSRLDELATRIGQLEGASDEVARCRSLAAMARVTAHTDPLAALGIAEEAVRLSKQCALRSALMLALHHHISVLIICGRLATKQGREAIEDVAAAVPMSSDAASHARILVNLAEWHTNVGHRELAHGFIEQASAAMESMDCPHIQGLERLARVKLALARQDAAEAESALARALDLETPEGTPEGRPIDRFHERSASLLPTPPSLDERLAAFGGILLLEFARFNRASRIAREFPLKASLDQAPVCLIVFHASLLSRQGETAAALALLERGATEKSQRYPLSWMRLALETVRMARRNATPRPELANRARAMAESLGLPVLAHDFAPFAD